MTEFQRTNRVFTKFLNAIKRHGMTHETDVLDNGDVRLRFWYPKDDLNNGFCIWYTDWSYSPYKLYSKGLDLLKDHDHSKFKNIKFS